MKNSPEVTIKIAPDLLKKLIYVSESEGRTVNNQFLMLARNSVAYFERAKGRIPADKLANIDISEYLE
jgi:hypothetical protein